MTDIDLSKIKLGDLVKIDVRANPDVEWAPVKGWREVKADELGYLYVSGWAVRTPRGLRHSWIRVRAHKPAPEVDERIAAWHKVAKRPAFTPCYDADGPLLDAMLARLDELTERKPAPVPIPTEPGTRFRATVMGVPDQIVTVLEHTPPDYITARAVKGCYLHTAKDITNVHDVVLP